MNNRHFAGTGSNQVARDVFPPFSGAAPIIPVQIIRQDAKAAIFRNIMGPNIKLCRTHYDLSTPGDGTVIHALNAAHVKSDQSDLAP